MTNITQTRPTIALPLSVIALNHSWNIRDTKAGLMSLAIDLARDGQRKPGEVVTRATIERFKDVGWVKPIFEAMTPEQTHFLLSGHRRYDGLQLAIERNLMGAKPYLCVDISEDIKVASDLRRFNIIENSMHRPLSNIEQINAVIRMRDVEKIDDQIIADMMGWNDDKGLRRVKEAAKMKDLHPAVVEEMSKGTIEWSAGLEMAKMSQADQASEVAKGNTTVKSLKQARQEKGEVTPRGSSGGVSYRTTRDVLSEFDAIVKAHADKPKCAQVLILTAFTSYLRSWTMGQTSEKLTNILKGVEEGRYTIGEFDLKSVRPADATNAKQGKDKTEAKPKEKSAADKLAERPAGATAVSMS